MDENASRAFRNLTCSAKIFKGKVYGSPAPKCLNENAFLKPIIVAVGSNHGQNRYELVASHNV